MTAQEPFFDASLEEIIGGRIVLLRRVLQRINFFDAIANTATRVIGDHVSAEAARRVARDGFEVLHKIISPCDVPSLIRLMGLELVPLSAHLVPALAHSSRCVPDTIFVADHTWVRIMMPEDIVADHREVLAGQYGHAVVHNPHRDSWFSQAINVVNMWMAIGRVRRGNSLLIYPDVFGQPLERDGMTIARTQRLGIPVNFELDAGDVLLFSGEHLHSSEINITDETRFVVSMRFTAKPPEYCGGHGRTPYYETDVFKEG